MYTELIDLGWSEWFEKRLQKSNDHLVARVVAVDRDVLIIVNNINTFRAKLSGAWFYRHNLNNNPAHELPCVGDWVIFEKHAQDDFGIIHNILVRKTSLYRKQVGDITQLQMIGANLDFVVIVQSCHFDFNIARLQRYMVMVNEGGTKPIILLTKTDLITSEALAQCLAEVCASGIDESTTPILSLSNINQIGIDKLQQLLMPTKTYCLVGSSGVGKSTLINRLIGTEQLTTSSVSGTGEGRHTTVRRELIRLPCGALVIDNPGMREFGVLGADDAIDDSYAQITNLANQCKFRDCQHTHDSGCSVLEAVKTGKITHKQLDNYHKLKSESAFNKMSYAEKREKSRNFAKFIKLVKKSKRCE